MNKTISIELVESNVRATAKLHEDRAPSTCEAIWAALSSPLETPALHGIWTGRCLEINLPDSHRTFDADAIPVENATTTPVIGDLLWMYLPSGRARSLFEGVWNVVLAYGPEAVMRTPLGPHPSNVWAEITEADPGFYEACAKQWFGKAERVRIERSE